MLNAEIEGSNQQIFVMNHHDGMNGLNHIAPWMIYGSALMLVLLNTMPMLIIYEVYDD